MATWHICTSTQLLQIMQVYHLLWTAVRNEHASFSRKLVRAIAQACCTPHIGLRQCATGYLMTPVSFDHIANFVAIIADNSASHATSRQHADSTDEDEDDSLSAEDVFRSLCSASRVGGWTVTELLGRKQCQGYFTILHSSNSPQLYVSTNIEALVGITLSHDTSHILNYVHTVKVHPDNPAYPIECARSMTTVPAKQPSKAAAFAAAQVHD